MRIAVAGIHIESCTFAMQVAGTSQFQVLTGEDLVADYPFRGWLGDEADDIEFAGTLVATTGATGPIDPGVYDAFEDEMARRLAEIGPVDGVYLDMHGAMSVLGRERAEESWLRRVRSVVGTDVVVSGSFDTHGNFSRELAELIDLAAFHRHAPHIDHEQTRERAVRNLVEVLRKGERPVKAWVRIPALLPGERTSSAVEPGATVFGAQLPVMEKYGLIDAAMCVGFFWADEPRNAAAVFTTAWDADAAIAGAQELARGFWEHVTEFQIVADRHGSWDEALDYALTRPPKPLFISDSGDNVTAGATGDITFALRRTLERDDVAGLRILFAGLWDPAAVDAAVAAGEGATLDRVIGAGADDRFGAPVSGAWQVVSLLTDPVASGVSGALLRRGNLDVSVQRRRAAFVRPDDPGFPPGVLRGIAPTPIEPYDAVVVKNGYLFPGQVEDAGSAFMAITPGGTDLDFQRLRFAVIERPLYPWDEGFAADLSATVIPTYSPAHSKEN